MGYCFLNDHDRLDKALMEALGCSRNLLKEYYQPKKKLDQKVRARVEYHLDLNLVNNLMINPNCQIGMMDILYEDENCLAINKTYNLHSHPQSYEETDNCLSYLRSKNYFEALDVNRLSYDRGLLYRLDYVTSGVLILIKREELFKTLRKYYHQAVKQKSYLAICEGELARSISMKHYLLSTERKGKKIKVLDEPVEGASAGECEVELMSFDKKNNLSLVKVELRTGLRHQIRAQLSHMGYPILGDELYGGRAERRVYLHALHYHVQWEKIDLSIVSKKAPLFDIFFNLDACL